MTSATIAARLPLLGTERSAKGSILTVGAFGTLLVLAVFSAAVTTVAQSTRALHGGVSAQTWTLSGMSLGLAAALLTVGALADDFGRRRVMIVSAALLAATSALAAAAPTMDLLIAARILQGVAGAGVITAALGSIGHSFVGAHDRAVATSVWGASVGAGIATGPLVGAALAQSIGWRSSYWLMAVSAAVLAAAATAVPQSRSSHRRPLDLGGAITLTAAMASLTAGLVEGRSSWTAATTVALLLAGVALLAGFSVIELHRRAPMLELGRLKHPLFVASLSGALFTGLGIIGLMSFTPLLLQRGLHMTLVGSAAVLAAWSATSTVIALATRPVLKRFRSPGVLALGFAISAVGEFALTGLGVGSAWSALLPGLLIAGVGSGLANASLGRLAVESVPRDRAGMGSGANNTARYLGGAAGVALVVALATANETAGAAGLLRGWDTAATVCAVLCLVSSVIAVLCRPRAQPA